MSLYFDIARVRWRGMDFLLPEGVTGVVWLVLAVVLGAAFAAESVRRRRAVAAVRTAEMRAAKERERAGLAEREMLSERARVAPLTEGHQHLLAALIRGFQDVGASRDKSVLLPAMAHAVERLFDASQLLVFVAADREGKEFQLVAASGPRDCGWKKGARLNDAMGRLGLVARRKATIDRREFECEPPIVREQLASTEPAGFVVDVASPIVVGGNVAAIVSVGGSTLPLDATRAGLELLIAHVAALLRAHDGAARVERLMNTDSMTGLGSKSWFVAEGAEALYASRSRDSGAALVVFGIDDFKGYVDRSGHEAADWLLRGVAEVVRPLCQEGVLLARWSGAEFVALLPGATPRSAHVFADRVRNTVSSVDWPNAGKQPRGRLTMSAGVAFLPENAQNLDDLIERAAESLTAARWNGDTTHSAQSDALIREEISQEIVNARRESAPAPTE
jgi:diguanylate cyclase (GGDEF)-like protein